MNGSHGYILSGLSWLSAKNRACPLREAAHDIRRLQAE